MKTDCKTVTTTREEDTRLIAENLELKREIKKLRGEIRDREELLCRMDRSLSQVRRVIDISNMASIIERWEGERVALTFVPAQYN